MSGPVSQRHHSVVKGTSRASSCQSLPCAAQVGTLERGLLIFIYTNDIKTSLAISVRHTCERLKMIMHRSLRAQTELFHVVIIPLVKPCAHNFYVHVCLLITLCAIY